MDRRRKRMKIKDTRNFSVHKNDTEERFIQVDKGKYLGYDKTTFEISVSECNSSPNIVYKFKIYNYEGLERDANSSLPFGNPAAVAALHSDSDNENTSYFIGIDKDTETVQFIPAIITMSGHIILEIEDRHVLFQCINVDVWKRFRLITDSDKDKKYLASDGKTLFVKAVTQAALDGKGKNSKNILQEINFKIQSESEMEKSTSRQNRLHCCCCCCCFSPLIGCFRKFIGKISRKNSNGDRDDTSSLSSQSSQSSNSSRSSLSSLNSNMQT